MSEITYQNKDVTAKVMAETLKGKSLAAFGLPHLKIMDILPTNLPAIESNELRLDNLFCSVMGLWRLSIMSRHLIEKISSST